jgi:DNA invertase Pin-like site-specific DNA recombinase
MAKKPTKADAKTRAPKGGPRIYSYRRFSSPIQSKGDSEARQQETSYEAAKRIAKERNMPFDEELFQGTDKLSAYTGAHIDKGALGKFLAAIELGEVKSGSILVVDGIDRLSRLPVLDGIEVVIGKIINRGGVSIFANGTEYSKANIKQTIYQLIAFINIAHENSDQKMRATERVVG